MTRQDFVKLPIRLLTAHEEYRIKRSDPFFVEFWKYGPEWPAINNRLHLEIGHDEQYRYIVYTRAAQAHRTEVTTQGGK